MSGPDALSTPRRAKRQYRLALALLTASGTATLGHELLWTRRLVDLTGFSTEASARTLVGFFLGLALGAAVAAKSLPKVQRPWRLLTIVELGTAGLCLPILWLPEWTAWLWPALGPERLAGWFGSLVKLAITFLLVTPPAFLMGMTLPLMAAIVGGSRSNASASGIWLYAANTFGGVVGLVAVVGLSLPAIGLRGSMGSMIGINLVIASLCWLTDRPTEKSSRAIVQDDYPATTASSQLADSWSLFVCFFSGAGILSLEVLGLHLFNLGALATFFLPATVLTCVILMMAVAAAIAPSGSRYLGGIPDALILSLAITGLLVALVPFSYMHWITAWGRLHYARNLTAFVLLTSGLTLLSLGPAILFAGTVFPLGVLWGNGSARRLGHCLAVNGVGGIIGSEISLQFLLPFVGVHVAIGVVGALYGLLSLTLWCQFKRNWRFGFAFAGILISLVGVLVTWVLPRLPVYFNSGVARVIDVNNGPEGSLAVVEQDSLGRALIFDNQYVLGHSGSAPDLERQAHVPLLLHPNPERIAFLGLGTGISAAGALRHSPVKSITVMELSPSVVRAAATHFREFNQNFCARSQVSIVVDDARLHIAATRDRYDVIIGDLFIPWRSGEASLCGLEHFQSVYKALRPGGLFCQWLPMHQLTPEQYTVITRTFQAVFPEVNLFRNHFKTKGIPLALIGFKGARLDWPVAAQRCSSERKAGRIADPVCRYPEGLAMLYLGKFHSNPATLTRLNMQGNLWVELDAGRQWITGHSHEYFVGVSEAWLALLKNQITRLEAEHLLPASLQALPKAGLLATQWEVAITSDPPAAPELYERFVAAVPNTMLSDSQADWTRWPGSQSPVSGNQR